MLISSSAVWERFIVPPEILLSEVFSTSLALSIFVVPPFWLNFETDVVVLLNLLFRFKMPFETFMLPFMRSFSPSRVVVPPLTLRVPVSFMVTAAADSI